jgi:hypothetical protein
VCVRARVAAFAILGHDGGLIIVRRRFLKHALPPNRPSFALAVLRKLAAKYAVGTVVIEPGCLVDSYVSDVQFRIRRLRLVDAKASIFGNGRTTHATLCNELVARYPKVARLVRLLEGKRISKFRPTDNVQLLAVAIGLAAQIRSLEEALRPSETMSPAP